MTGRLVFIAGVLLGLAAPRAAPAGPALLLTPNRVVLGDRDREATVTVSNAGDEPGGYRLYFQNYRMTEAGAFEAVTGAAAGLTSDQLVRFSPRQLVLAPGETQVVRLAVRRPAGLKPGEYRSHLVFQGVPRKGDKPAVTSGKGRSRAAVTTLFAVSIPVIYRFRTAPAEVAIAGAAVVQDERGARVSVELARGGDESLYGNVKVAYRAPGAERFEPVGESNGNAVYVPLRRRFVSVPVNTERLAKGGVLRVVFETDAGVLASKDVPIE